MIKLTQHFLDKVMEIAKQERFITREPNGEWMLKYDAITLEYVGYDKWKIGLSYEGEKVAGWDHDIGMIPGYGDVVTLSGVKGSIKFSITPA